MENCHGVSTPLVTGSVLDDEEPTSELCHVNVPFREAVGSLMYLMTGTRPDLATALSMVSRHLAAPRVVHWIAVKRIFRYVAKTVNFGLLFSRQHSLNLSGFSDADWAGDLATRKSRTGMIFLFGGGAISWQSNLQEIVTLSTAEAEYVAANEAGKEMIWFRTLLKELGEPAVQSDLFVDNQSAIKLALNQ